MKQFFYLAWWYFQVRFLGRKKPLQTVIFINNECNLRCKHCWVDKNSAFHRSYEEIKSDLEYSYKLGSRFVDFEGGEPTLWHDSGHENINELIKLAKKIGFFSVTVTTNAQKPFDWVEADSMWVSLDGVNEYHDAVRGQGAFEKLLENVSKYNKGGLSANMVINKLNEASVEDTIKFVKENPNLQSISLNFHMPYEDTADLCADNRTEIVDKIIEMKRLGYPIMNTFSGLRELKRVQDGEKCWITNFVLPDGTRREYCQGKDFGMCKNCGYGMAGEMKNVFYFNPETLLAGLKLRVFKNR